MTGGDQPRLKVLYLSWRDRGNPEAGGSETFVARTSEVLTSRGHEVTVFTSRFPGSSAEERHGAVRVLRRGGRLAVFPRAMAHLARRGRSYDVVLDVQNGVPFWSPLFTRTPAINIVHHLHREQWASMFGPAVARFGWWLESRLAPRVYRGSPYLTVSDATRQELAALGVEPERISLVYSGNDQPRELARYAALPRHSNPMLVAVGRLVPHKRLELAIDLVADLAERVPGLTLHVVGDGFWREQLEAHAQRAGVAASVVFHGFVPEETKNVLLAEAWVAVLPSVKEGWGLTIVEAGLHETPTVAFRDAGGPQESIVDGETGLLANGYHDFRDGVLTLLTDEVIRVRMGKAARRFAEGFDWTATGIGVERAAARAATRGTLPSAGKRRGSRAGSLLSRRR